jgi:uncharacterized membrane protein
MSLEPLLSASPQIQLHVFSASLALITGPFALWRKRRDRVHKTFGYVFILSMFTAICSSFFILDIRLFGPFSPIHALSVLATVLLWKGYRHIRAGRIAQHAATMRGLYLQALGIAFLFTFLPGRLMNRVLFPDAPELGAWLITGLGLPLLGALIFAGWIRKRFSSFLHTSPPL